jgi:hypothetical protein
LQELRTRASIEDGTRIAELLDEASIAPEFIYNEALINAL